MCFKTKECFHDGSGQRENTILSVLKQNLSNANYRYCLITDKIENITLGLLSLTLVILALMILLQDYLLQINLVNRICNLIPKWCG